MPGSPTKHLRWGGVQANSKAVIKRIYRRLSVFKRGEINPAPPPSEGRREPIGIGLVGPAGVAGEVGSLGNPKERSLGTLAGSEAGSRG